MAEDTLAILVTLKDLSEQGLRNVQSNLAATERKANSTNFGGFTKAAGAVEKATIGMGNALHHASGFVGNLVSGPLGFLGLGAAAFSLAGALKNGIDTANTMALSIEKLTALTGESATAMSGLLAVTGKFGIAADQVGTIVGFEEKTVGKLTETTAKATKAGKSAALQALENTKLKDQATGASTKHIDKLIAEQKAHDALTGATATASVGLNKLQALQKQYGVTLTDSTGKALDFSTILNHVSDYYNSNATQGQKAALAATLFGRGYAALIPVLQLGSAGFAKAQQAATSLGLTLTSQNASDLLAYQENWRNLGDAVSGLQLQLSLELLPTLNDLAKSVTSFVTSHETDIKGFFEGAISAGREVGGVLVSVASDAIGAWNKIPPQLRDLLIQALVGNKVIKTVFGINIIGTVEGAIASVGKSLLSSIAGSIFGKTVATPVVNVDGAVVNVGGVGGGLSGAAGGAGTAATGGGIAGGLATAGTLMGGAAAVAITAYLTDKLIIDKPTITSGGGSAGKYGAAPGTYGRPLPGSPDVPVISAVTSGAALIHQAIIGTLVARLTATAGMFKSLFEKVIGITAAQREDIAKNLQLQRVLSEAHHRLTYAALLAKSHADHVEHIETLAKLDKITVAEELVKLATLSIAKLGPGAGRGAIGAHASGGWVGMNGPELSWVGEQGPEYISPSGRGGGNQPITLITQLVVDGKTLAQVVTKHLARSLNVAPKTTRPYGSI